MAAEHARHVALTAPVTAFVDDPTAARMTRLGERGHPCGCSFADRAGARLQPLRQEGHPEP